MTEEEQRELELAMAAALTGVYLGIQKLDAQMQDQLLELFDSAAADAARVLRANAGPDGVVPAHALPSVVGQIELILMQLRDDQLAAAQDAVEQAASNGSKLIDRLVDAATDAKFPRSAISGLPSADQAANEIVQAVVNNIAEDGLNLSDRIWRNYGELRATLLPMINIAISEGTSARDAARAAVLWSGIADERLLMKIEMAKAGALGDQAREILARPEARAYANALRVFRTEMDRANIMAARAGMYATEGVVGTRFRLSPNHPRYDICDVHANVNLYGLGRGGYPPGYSPLPAHPNTLSYEEAIFEWEVTDEDREGQHDLLGWLSGRSDDQLYGALGQSWNKVSALRQGLLQPDEVTLPWRVLSAKYGAQVQGP